MSDEPIKYITLENLAYFLEKFKYEMAHNGPKEEEVETQEDSTQQ